MSRQQQQSPVRRLFGTDGVRGIANTELSPQRAMALGAAAAIVLSAESGASREIVIGRDPRLSGDLLMAALIAGIGSQGVNVLDVGVIPTPGVATITQVRGAAAGAVISASHNPMQDNGIKFFGADGHKLDDAIEAEIESAMEHWEERPRPSGADVGRVLRDGEGVEVYIDRLKASSGGRLEGMTLIADCANGAASFLAPRVLAELGCVVTTLSAAPDGININDNCGSLHPEAMAAKVIALNCEAGMAFDGDADRVILSDEKGRIFDGDRILCAVGLWMKRQGTLKNDVVIGTTMSNLGLEKALAEREVTLIRADVGDRYVMEQMKAHGATLGGEKSGHILFPALSTTGDGLLSALQVLRLVRESGRKLSEWANEMQEYPQKLVSIKVRDKNGWQTIPGIVEAIRAAEVQLAGRGRLNVRPSGTEKKIRVMAEGPDSAEVETIVANVAAAIEEALGA